VHRDFKPGNVLLERHEDDSWCRASSIRARDSRPAIRPELPGRLTEAGFIIGNAGYIAPEQVLDLGSTTGPTLRAGPW